MLASYNYSACALLGMQGGKYTHAWHMFSGKIYYESGFRDETSSSGIFPENPVYLASMLMAVRTPIHTQAWEAALSTHPDRAFAQYVSDGLQNGFYIGFQWESPLGLVTTNMESARQHPGVVQEYIDKEISKGRMLGPFIPDFYPFLHINCFRVIPKGNNTGKWRLITDLL